MVFLCLIPAYTFGMKTQEQERIEQKEAQIAQLQDQIAPFFEKTDKITILENIKALDDCSYLPAACLIADNHNLSFAAKLELLHIIRKKTALASDAQITVQKLIEEFCQKNIESILQFDEIKGSSSLLIAALESHLKSSTTFDAIKEKIDELLTKKTAGLSDRAIQALIYVIIFKNDSLSKRQKESLCDHLIEIFTQDSKRYPVCDSINVLKRIKSYLNQGKNISIEIMWEKVIENDDYELINFLLKHSLKPQQAATLAFIAYTNKIADSPEKSPMDIDAIIGLLLDHSALVQCMFPLNSTICKPFLSMFIIYCSIETINRIINAGADINWIFTLQNKTKMTGLDMLLATFEQFQNDPMIQEAIDKARACGAKTYAQLIQKLP